MTDERQQRIANAKSIVSAVLNGDITPERNPTSFEDDVVYISVRIAELHEPDWLLEQIRKTDPAAGGLPHVIDCMGPLRARAEALRDRKG